MDAEKPLTFRCPRPTPSQNERRGRCYDMNSQIEALETVPDTAPFDFDATFRAQYARVARTIARVVRDSARAEELAVEVFLKLWRSPRAQGE